MSPRVDEGLARRRKTMGLPDVCTVALRFLAAAQRRTTGRDSTYIDVVYSRRPGAFVLAIRHHPRLRCFEAFLDL